MLMHHTLDCAKSRLNPESHWLVYGSFLLTESFCKNYLSSVTSLWWTFVNPFLVVHPTHILVYPRVHRAHRLKRAALDNASSWESFYRYSVVTRYGFVLYGSCTRSGACPTAQNKPIDNCCTTTTMSWLIISPSKVPKTIRTCAIANSQYAISNVTNTLCLLKNLCYFLKIYVENVFENAVTNI